MSTYDINELGKRAKKASAVLTSITSNQKNQALQVIADKLRNSIPVILEQNNLDIQSAKEHGISEVMTDRLALSEARIQAIASAAEKVIDLDDPVGEIIGGKLLPNGLMLSKHRVPLGVIGIIFESRPNVTVDAAVLCLKSSNAVILRGGKEALHSNTILANLMREALEEAGLPKDCINLVENTSREVAAEMMRMNDYLDVLIPRGGAGLIQAIINQATVPVIETGTGNCHVYVDQYADLEMAVNIVHNAKTSRPSVCNACESLLVHKAIADQFLPAIAEAFTSHQVLIAGCERTRAILGNDIPLATEEDYAEEFLDYKISVKVIDTPEEAIAHINHYTTHHSECIVTQNIKNARQFTTSVDAAAVYVNASTRYTDGEEFGLGAEIGISTQKLHARGPMGLTELTTIKYVIEGDGQIR